VRDEVKYGGCWSSPRRCRHCAAVSRRSAPHRLPREKVMATVVALLEKTLIRVGNEEYARANPILWG
jgi:DNA topoisomerase-1